jgi:MSHA biogenesis protein MshK
MKNLSLYSVCALVLSFFSLNTTAQLRDPTQPFVQISNRVPASQNTALKLQSIIKKNTVFKAIISGQLYQKGDTVNDFRVLSINSKQVLLANDDKQIKLELYDYEIKK